MKKLTLILFLFCSGAVLAQEEFKVNITDALALKTLNVSYEHYVTEQTSVGVSALFNFENESSDFRYNEDQMFTPFVRHYFSTQSTWNLFGELFFAYNKGDEETVVNNIPVSEDYSDGALGLAIGYKYISSGGFTVDVHGGLGRNLFSKDSPTIVPRVGVNIGFQFQ
ncbi:DUF3575 domain-containing protein [Pseudotenacibaculum haliotis]|uniref:DUF3575 domain-containing protein n=1 Tax=Pseudotenacibaculum haliotis TaxID=1862138 RepID=A0ABW5LXS9_9FLAO